jgi:hypothetical protein
MCVVGRKNVTPFVSTKAGTGSALRVHYCGGFADGSVGLVMRRRTARGKPRPVLIVTESVAVSIFSGMVSRIVQVSTRFWR